MRDVFGILCTCFCFRGRLYFLIGWSLWSCLDFIVSRCFTLYFTFQLLPHCLYFVGLFMLGGVYFMFLVSNFLLIYDYEFFIIICLYCLCLKSRCLFFLYLYFFHTCGYAFCLSVSRNIQVDSIKLLSTLAIDGQQLGLNLSF